MSQVVANLNEVMRRAGVTAADVLGVGVGVPTGTPLLIVRRVTADSTDRPLLLEETRISADDSQLAYPIQPRIAD